MPVNPVIDRVSSAIHGRIDAAKAAGNNKLAQRWMRELGSLTGGRSPEVMSEIAFDPAAFERLAIYAAQKVRRMIGAFVGYFALSVYHLPWGVALGLGMAAAWVLGGLIEKMAFRPLRSAGHMPPLLITIGLSIILKDLAVIVFGAENRPVPSVYETTIRVGGVSVSVLQLVILGLAGALVLALQLLLKSTKIGRAMRATAQDHEAAYAMGVNVNRVFNISFALASALGGAAGVMVGIYYNTVYPAMGGTAGLKGFAACIFGGLTSIPGASAAFRGGVVAYAADLKAAVLGVPDDLLERRGAVDAAVAEAMAEGARTRMWTTVGVATTGVAGPDPAEGKPVGTVYVAVAGPARTTSRALALAGARDVIRMATVESVLALLIATMREEED